MIKWIYGNTLPIAAKLKKTTKTEQGSVTEDYTPPQGSIIRPAVVGKYTKKVYNECSIDGNVVTFTDDGTLGVGTYGIEIRVIEPDKNLRSFKCGELTILNCSEDLDLGEFLDNGAAVIDAMPYFWAKGDKGDPFTYNDFTAEQIAELQRPATDAATELTQEVHTLEQQFTEQEGERVVNENTRKENELERQRAESERHQLFSVDHQQAVSDHAQYEQDHTKELQRQLNESQRQQAETTREQAETSRNTNESNRQQAETQREETFATYRPIIDAKLDMISQEQFNQIFE